MDAKLSAGEALSVEDQELVDGLLAGKRRPLAKTITLIESTLLAHQQRARKVVASILPHTGRAIRVGVSGVPGAGKSTFIEVLGIWLIERGHKLAILAVDPSSSLSGGSILGDKTRMEMLCQHEEAFIRPSPSAGSLGGVAAKTREAMLACEAAGYDVILVETVGVGQSETTVAGMVDMFVLLQLPNQGDELQAIKKGIVEIADLVAINKIDINPNHAAVCIAQWKQALHMLRPTSPNWTVPVIGISAMNRIGVDEFWGSIERYRETMTKTGELEQKRRNQALSWMWSMIEGGLKQLFRNNPVVEAELPKLSQQVSQGLITPGAASEKLLDYVRSRD
ncbi:MAG: methylmalonyl Co-A mutase-associated GTPase MeaB [Candidatus Accumulibacter sp.]|jgi:LAO/AO transport system kinase|nr:methylmalonyl Co-A mutase-associated GTPase MeaB [Accumulibacter sp.]